MATCSIIVPCAAGDDRVFRALASLLSASEFLTDRDALEVHIVVDGGATRAAWLADFISRTEPFHERLALHIHVMAQQEGVSSARNAGMAAATGHWVFFLDSDDEVIPRAFATCVRQLGHSESNLIVAAFESCSISGVSISGPCQQQLLDRNQVFRLVEDYLDNPTRSTLPTRCWGIFFRKSTRGPVIDFDSSLRNFEDVDFVARFLQQSHSLELVPTPVVRHYVHPPGRS